MVLNPRRPFDDMGQPSGRCLCVKDMLRHRVGSRTVVLEACLLVIASGLRIFLSAAHFCDLHGAHLVWILQQGDLPWKDLEGGVEWTTNLHVASYTA